MKLSKESWHYRAYSATFKGQPADNLCGYFWLAMFSIIMFPFFYVFYKPFEWTFKKQDPAWKKSRYVSVMFFPAFGTWILTFFAVAMIGVFFVNHDDTFWAFGMAGWVLTGIAGIIVLALFIKTNLDDKARERRRAGIYPVKKKKKPSIIVEYLKAVKEKTCPRIQWVDSYEGIPDDEGGV